MQTPTSIMFSAEGYSLDAPQFGAALVPSKCDTPGRIQPVARSFTLHGATRSNQLELDPLLPAAMAENRSGSGSRVMQNPLQYLSEGEFVFFFRIISDLSGLP